MGRDRLAKFLARGLKNMSGSKPREELKQREELVGEACRTKSKCMKRKPSETLESRVKVMEQRLERQNDEVDETLRELEKELKKEKKTKRKNARTMPDDL